MIYSTDEIKSFIAASFGEEAELGALAATGSMTARLEDGGSDTLLSARAGDRELVVKMKSRAFDDAVCYAMNYLDSKEFEEYFQKGKYIFYIRDSYNREQKMYEAFAPLKEYFPRVYGAESDGVRSIILMEKLSIDRTPDNATLAKFLYNLHSLYTCEEEAKALGANVHTRKDYLAATSLSLALIDYIRLAYPSFPSRILLRAEEFIRSYGLSFDKMASYKRVVCHGDLTINNLSTAEGIKAYDLELATFNNPEFDLVSYLVHYPTPLSGGDIEELLCAYYGEEGSSIKEKEDVLKLNVLLYFCTRFHAMMMIAKKLPMPYMATSVANYVYLFNYFAL